MMTIMEREPILSSCIWIKAKQFKSVNWVSSILKRDIMHMSGVHSAQVG